MKVKNLLIVAIVIILILGCGWAFFVPKEFKNKLSRAKYSMHGGDFKITYTDQQYVKTWIAKDQKITSDPKGFYYFWVDKKYVQVPVQRTIIEGL